MIPKAKAALADVKLFEMAVTAASDYSNNLHQGIVCLEELRREMQERAAVINESVSKLDASISLLETKRRETEKILNEFKEKLHELTTELASLQDDLAQTPPSFEETDANGATIYTDNPEYESLESEIADVKIEINQVEAEIAHYEEKLQRMTELWGKIVSKATEMKGISESLRVQESECRILLHGLEEIKAANGKNSAIASDNLKQLEKVIDKYKRIKMEYDSRGLPLVDMSIGINIAINVVNSIPNQRAMDQIRSDDAEIKASDTAKPSGNQIVYDEEGHICEYNGRTFGGQYNSYKTRCDASSKPDPLLGWYEGERGESKYIPSQRNAQGLLVTEVLKRYGMDGIVYRNAEPDFEDCSEAVVTIPRMTEYRDINFLQADTVLAEQWNAEAREGRRNWHPEEVVLYRKANSLSWHEKCDTRTMVLVNTDINLYFKHLGGVSECKVRDAAGEVGSEFDE